MKVHLIEKIYDNGNSVIQDAYSSHKKALDALNKDLAIYSADGYDVTMESYGSRFEWHVKKTRESGRLYQYWFKITSKPVL